MTADELELEPLETGPRPAALARELLTEDQLQTTIVGAARARRWLVAHFRPAQTRGGRWATPMQGHKGFPDLVLARRGVVFAWELKGYTFRKRGRPTLGEPTVEQLAWLEALAGGVDDARVVTPELLDDALRALELGRWP